MKRSPAGGSPISTPVSTRRDALKSLGVFAALAAVGGVLTQSSSAEASGPAATLADNAYFARLEGRDFAGSTVQKVGQIEYGGAVIELADAKGQTFIIDALRFDPASPGVAQAGAIGLYIRSGRRRRTDEQHGLAAMHLAAELVRRQEGGTHVPALLTLSERASVRQAALGAPAPPR